jgi:hypothetical protein
MSDPTGRDVDDFDDFDDESQFVDDEGGEDEKEAHPANEASPGWTDVAAASADTDAAERDAQTKKAAADKQRDEAKKAAAPSRPRGPWTQSLPVKLTEPEIVGLAREAAEKQQRLEALEQEKKSTSASYKAQIEGERTLLKHLASVITSGTDMRSVECREVRDHRRGTVAHVRQDTGETIILRPMTAEERQTELFDRDGNVVAVVDPEKPKTKKKGRKAKGQGAGAAAGG